MALNPLGYNNITNTAASFPEPLLQDLWQAAVKKDPIYELFKNTVIKGDYQFLLDLYTPADITECIILKNFLYFRGTL